MTNKKWYESFKTHIWVFNVGRGLSIFIRTPLNQGILYDFVCSDDFKHTNFLKENIIPMLDKYKNCNLAQILISHPHADHISDIKNMIGRESEKSIFYSSLHTCPHDKTEGSAKPEAINWDRIKNPDGSDELISIYKKLYAERSLPLQAIVYESNRSVPNLEYGFFYIRPPVVDTIHPSDNQDYGNGVSLVVFYRHGKHTLLIPGDITPLVLSHILEESKGLEKRYTIFDMVHTCNHPKWHLETNSQPSLKELLSNHGLSVLVAPHHGLESGFSDDLYAACKSGKPDLVIISDKRHMTETDGKIDSRYQTADGANGMYVKIDDKEDFRYSVSTRSGHHILITFQGTGGCPDVHLNKNPNELLKILDN
jgi:beta-lactamase superfamily II metal-dependent hydrolase